MLPDQHPQIRFYQQLMGRARLERGSCNPRWYAVSLFADEASVAIYTGQAHTGNYTSLPCMGWTPAEGGGKKVAYLSSLLHCRRNKSALQEIDLSPIVSQRTLEWRN